MTALSKAELAGPRGNPQAPLKGLAGVAVPDGVQPLNAELRRQAQGEILQAPLKGELPPQRLRGCGRHLRFYETLGEYVTAPLASPGGKLARPNGA